MTTAGELKARAVLADGGYSGIVCPGECGCRLDDLMPCCPSPDILDQRTGIPIGCTPGHAHTDPRGGGHWVVSTSAKAPSPEAFDLWLHNT